MPRSRRRTVSQDIGSIHIISRVAGGELIFNDGEKEFFLKLLERLASGFFVEIHAFCIMSNHFHILTTWLDKEARDASKEELLERYRNIFGEDADPPAGKYDSDFQLIPDADGGMERLRRRLGSISSFVKELKQNFSSWYNKHNDRFGCLWSERFKGVIVSKGEAQLAGSAYIDLNPVRAAIVQKPEDYRWSSLGLRVRDPERAKKLLRPLSILPGFDDSNKNDADVTGTVDPPFIPIVLSENSYDHFSTYREFVYKTGGVERSGSAHLPVEIVNEVVAYHGKFGVADRFRYRVKNFSEGIAFGNYAMIAELQKLWNRKKIRPRSFMDKGRDAGCGWSYASRVLRL